MVDERERAHWVAFNHAPGIGPRRVRRLLDRFGSLAAAWMASRRELAQAELDRRTLEGLDALRRRLEPERELARVRQLGAEAITWQDGAYPARLAAIADPPPLLYVRGGLGAGDDLPVAVVGTRRPTFYGRDVAERLAAGLAAAGATVVSGLARGIDTCAHRGALRGGGRTVAVLAHGIDFVYPSENRRLADQIVAQGALVTDYPAGTHPAGENFPPRNRIIAGLSAGVLVVEAGEGSGALITSHYAAEQGRDVFAVPGPITSPASRGCNLLIQDGAKLVTGLEDVLEELRPALPSAQLRQLALDFGTPDGERGRASGRMAPPHPWTRASWACWRTPGWKSTRISWRESWDCRCRRSPAPSPCWRCWARCATPALCTTPPPLAELPADILGFGAP